MEPYYTIMRLPGEKQEEFILLLPFTPRNRTTCLHGWPHAAMRRLRESNRYNFPKQKLVYGPRQIEARIDQDTEIFQTALALESGRSQVIRGSLLAIPIEKSILYVESLYLAAEKSQLPELKRVIVAFGNAIAMEENLELALQRIFGGELMREKGNSQRFRLPQPQWSKRNRTASWWSRHSPITGRPGVPPSGQLGCLWGRAEEDG